MDTKILETFLLVAESSVLSTAASIMGVPQSQVSRHIKELERSCNSQLFYRHGRGVKLTVVGEQLRESISPILEQLRGVLHDVSKNNRSIAGSVDVAMSPTFIRAIGLQILDVMAASHPDIHVRLISGNSRYIYEWLLHSQVDIGILSDAGLSSQLLLEELGLSRVVLAAHPDFPLPSEGRFPPELDGIPLRLPSRGQGFRRIIDLWANKHGITLNAAYEVDDLDLSRQIVSTGRAAAIMSRLSIAQELHDRTFIERSLGDNFTVRTVLATARNRPVTPVMKATIIALREVTRSLFETCQVP